MMFTKIKNINLIKTLILVFILLVTFSINFTYAAISCDNYESVLNDPKDRNALAYIVCPVIRIINAAFVFVSAVFIIMLVYGGIKASLSLGDPKALQGARDTWTWTVLGTLFVLFALALVKIMFTLLGVDDFSFESLLDLDTSLQNLWDNLK